MLGINFLLHHETRFVVLPHFGTLAYQSVPFK